MFASLLLWDNSKAKRQMFVFHPKIGFETIINLSNTNIIVSLYHESLFVVLTTYGIEFVMIVLTFWMHSEYNKLCWGAKWVGEDDSFWRRGMWVNIAITVTGSVCWAWLTLINSVNSCCCCCLRVRRDLFGSLRNRTTNDCEIAAVKARDTSKCLTRLLPQCFSLYCSTYTSNIPVHIGFSVH